MYVEPKDNEETKLYRLAKTRDRKTQDLDQMKCINNKEGKVLMEDTLTR